MSDTPKPESAHDRANRLLAPLGPAILAAFAKVRPGKPPQSLRALHALALLFLAEAFGLAFLLTREQREAALAAARAPGRLGKDDDVYDPTDDSPEAKAAAWVAARRRAFEDDYSAACREHLDRAYDAYVREIEAIPVKPKEKRPKPLSKKYFAESPKYQAPDFGVFERYWASRNPIDPATVPAGFDPRVQLDLVDACTTHDGLLGVFVSEQWLRNSTSRVLRLDGHELDLTRCTTIGDALAAAFWARWVCYLDTKGAVIGLRLLPPTDGVRVRLRAPLINLEQIPLAPLTPLPADGPPTVFLSLVRLQTGTASVELHGRRLSLQGCRTLKTCAMRAIESGWGAIPAVQEGLLGLRFCPTDYADGDFSQEVTLDALAGSDDPGPASHDDAHFSREQDEHEATAYSHGSCSVPGCDHEESGPPSKPSPRATAELPEAADVCGGCKTVRDFQGDCDCPTALAAPVPSLPYEDLLTPDEREHLDRAAQALRDGDACEVKLGARGAEELEKPWSRQWDNAESWLGRFGLLLGKIRPEDARGDRGIPIAFMRDKEPGRWSKMAKTERAKCAGVVWLRSDCVVIQIGQVLS